MLYNMQNVEKKKRRRQEHILLEKIKISNVNNI